MSSIEQPQLNEDLNITTDTTLAPTAPGGGWNDHNLDFDEIIQEFGAKVGIICALEHGQKIAPKEAYRQIKSLFKQLKTVKRSVYPRPGISEAS